MDDLRLRAVGRAEGARDRPLGSVEDERDRQRSRNGPAQKDGDDDLPSENPHVAPLSADTEGCIGMGGRKIKQMRSFKLKLVVYFLLLALVPLAAAFWGFSSIAARSETRQADARLQSSLSAGLAAYQDSLDAAVERADRVAFVAPGALRLPAGRTATVRFDDLRYRAVVSQPLEGAAGRTLAVLTPQSRIDAATSRTESRLLAALLATLALFGLVA